MLVRDRRHLHVQARAAVYNEIRAVARFVRLKGLDHGDDLEALRTALGLDAQVHDRGLERVVLRAVILVPRVCRDLYRVRLRGIVAVVGTGTLQEGCHQVRTGVGVAGAVKFLEPLHSFSPFRPGAVQLDTRAAYLSVAAEHLMGHDLQGDGALRFTSDLLTHLLELLDRSGEAVEGDRGRLASGVLRVVDRAGHLHLDRCERLLLLLDRHLTGRSCTAAAGRERRLTGALAHHLATVRHRGYTFVAALPAHELDRSVGRLYLGLDRGPLADLERKLRPVQLDRLRLAARVGVRIRVGLRLRIGVRLRLWLGLRLRNGFRNGIVFATREAGYACDGHDGHHHH